MINSKLKNKNAFSAREKRKPNFEGSLYPTIISQPSKPFEDNYSLPVMRGASRNLRPKIGSFKIIIRNVEMPLDDKFESRLAWICSTLGFFEPIDKDKNSAAIIKQIILATEQNKGLTSTEIAERIGVSRGSTISHLNKIKKSGLIEKRGKKYFAKGSSMLGTIGKLEEEVNAIFKKLRKTAEQIDKEFDGL
jgi:predicted transcriptional regulator